MKNKDFYEEQNTKKIPNDFKSERETKIWPNKKICVQLNA